MIRGTAIGNHPPSMTIFQQNAFERNHGVLCEQTTWTVPRICRDGSQHTTSMHSSERMSVKRAGIVLPLRTNGPTVASMFSKAEAMPEQGIESRVTRLLNPRNSFLLFSCTGLSHTWSTSTILRLCTPESVCCLALHSGPINVVVLDPHLALR